MFSVNMNGIAAIKLQKQLLMTDKMGVLVKTIFNLLENHSLQTTVFTEIVSVKAIV